MSNILLCGNPNVGKSSIFNVLTGSNEHTGNWTGKTVDLAEAKIKGTNFNLIDLPGIYSLSSLSDEEIIARDTLLFGDYEKIIYVMDSSNVERNMNLLLQILEINKNVIVCFNMIDELEDKGISIDYDLFSDILGVSVVKCSTKNKVGIDDLINSLKSESVSNFNFLYNVDIENKVNDILELLDFKFKNKFIALSLLEKNKSIVSSIKNKFNIDINTNKINDYLMNVNEDDISNNICYKINDLSKEISSRVVTRTKEKKISFLDKLFTNKFTAVVLMILIVFGIFLITIVLANYPSDLLSLLFTKIENVLYNLCIKFSVPEFIYEPLLFGVYRVVSFIVSVMFPPLVIFFFLFTYAEEAGILPRIAFNFDRICKCAGCHGKQALTICSGFGCNACAIVGSRIIDSKRDKLLAILTNAFIPCNGRFPMIIAIISMFFVNSNNKLLVSLYLTMFVLFAILISFLTSFILSKTILKGTSGFFVLELPDYKKVSLSRIFKISFVNKSLSILKKAILVSIPSGIIIWILNNTSINNVSVYSILSNFLEPFSKLMGLDGVILLAFIIGLPANEIVLPLIIMGYLKSSNVPLIADYTSIKSVLVENGWTITTAISTILFSIMHFPCATTLATIKSEVGSKWMLYAFIIPLITGISFLIILNLFI